MTAAACSAERVVKLRSVPISARDIERNCSDSLVSAVAGFEESPIHVHPAAVRAAARAKRDRLLLITDRIDPPAEGGLLGDGILTAEGPVWRLPDGTLAGSRLELAEAVQNATSFGGMSRLEAVAAATLRPARLLGVEAERGTLRVGARADFALLAPDGTLAETWLAGRRVFAR